MGDGKTEAAWYVADRTTAALGQAGAYVALPTMATSNQMFDRVAGFLAHRFPDEPVNTQLLHGHAALSADFRALREEGRRYLSELAIPGDAGDAPSDAPGVLAASWFTSRKRGLLAPYGVGTVDQALRSVLQTRHFFVRLHGLAGKTVVLDEVHAYDAYMSTLLERLIAWLAAMGSTVVLLSATLPLARRERLVRAYLDGIDTAATVSDAATSAIASDGGTTAPAPVPYPAVTTAIGGAVATVAVEASDRGRKELALVWRADGGATAERLGPDLRAALIDGGCAAVVCNTVGAAQRLYEGLTAWFADDELLLFHARFRYEERERIEQEVLEKFGKPGTGERPRRCVLVATQVVEQSLDLDFDLIVTELAPVDLVLQRAGRLHRHEREGALARPAGLRTPVLWIAGPEEADRLPDFPRADTWVYAEHVLLRSWLALRDQAAIRIPEEIPGLVEAVYDDDRPCPEDPDTALGERWEATKTALLATRSRDEGKAAGNAIPGPAEPVDALLGFWNQQLDEDDSTLHPTLQALTRLGDPSVTTVVLRPEEVADYRPRATVTPERAEALLRRSVRIGQRGVTQALIAAATPASWAKNALVRHCRLVELDDADAAIVGGRRLRLDPKLGVVVERPEQEEEA